METKKIYQISLKEDKVNERNETDLNKGEG
jgi:hypothetical protein